MKRTIILAFTLAVSTVLAQETGTDVPSQPSGSGAFTPTPTILRKWDGAAIPWGTWFKDNALVTDKGDYIHFFWNAQDFKANFETKDKKVRLAEAALALVRMLYPQEAKADLVKVDIVYVLERDSYGAPKWDSLQQVAHLEFKRSKMPKDGKKKVVLTAAVMKKVFLKFDLF